MYQVSSPARLPELAETYAPIVVLHADEKLRPAPVAWFLERSALRWATGRGLTGEKVSDAVDASRLGAASAKPYEHHDFAASALTRPLDGAGRVRPAFRPSRASFSACARSGSPAAGTTRRERTGTTTRRPVG